jgi:hypothetical protein
MRTGEIVDNKVTLKISASAAPYVKADTSKEDKLKAARGEVSLAAHDLVVLLFFLGHDQDPEVRSVALTTLRGLSEACLTTVLADNNLHPKLLDMMARLHSSKETIGALLVSHPNIEVNTINYLKDKGIVAETQGAIDDTLTASVSMDELVTPPEEPLDTEEDETVPPEDEEEFKSKYQQIQSMGIAEKIKIALTGDKEFRSMLIKDSNKLVSGAVVKNPRITEGEILTISKSAIQNDEVLRVICANKEWVKNYMIRKALVENSKTPLPVALRFLGTLTDKDLEKLAKSKNVSTVIATQARRLASKIKK